MRLNKNSGYSMVDMILAVSVVITLVVITFPHITSYLNVQKTKEEQEVQQKIKQGLHAMARQKGHITNTNDIEDLAEDLSEYLNISQPQIIFDAWGNRRYYRQITETRNYRDTDVDIHYAFVFSAGEGDGSTADKGCYGEGPNQECDAAIFEPQIDALLMSEDDFQTLNFPEGDVGTSYSDLELKVAGYKETKKRVESIVAALEEFERTNRYAGIANGQNPDKIYYPADSVAGYSASLYWYSNDKEQILDDALGGSLEVDTAGSDQQRYESMRSLMRVIGLPEEFCCTPLHKVEINDEWVERPMYYYSNTRVRLGASNCAPRPSSVSARKLPARISVDPYVCG